VLDAVRATGAEHVLVSGSGPTVVGLFPDPEAARRAARTLAERHARAVAARPLTAADAEAVPA